jgi:plasmid stabilization system protein ParE
LESGADWWVENHSVRQAARWHEVFSAEIESLRNSPDRFPLAEESSEFNYELRELHYGLGARPTHRAVYTIVSEILVVLTIRHGAQRALRPGDIEPDLLGY